MLKITCEGVYYKNGGFVPAKDGPAAGLPAPEKAREGTMAHAILKAHNTGDNMEELAIRFDAMASHDITYVGIIQTARASGMQAFPLPYVLTNCHNSLCAVGGTINEDDHVFGLSAGAVRRPRQGDPGLRLPHPLRRLRHHGHRRGRSGAGPAAFIKNL